MSAEITVVFHMDLTHLISGRLSPKESSAFDARLKSTKNAEAPGLNIQMGSETLCVLDLPKNEKVFGALVYWCNEGHFPYKTLWLNDAAQWQERDMPPLHATKSH